MWITAQRTEPLGGRLAAPTCRLLCGCADMHHRIVAAVLTDRVVMRIRQRSHVTARAAPDAFVGLVRQRRAATQLQGGCMVMKSMRYGQAARPGGRLWVMSHLYFSLLAHRHENGRQCRSVSAEYRRNQPSFNVLAPGACCLLLRDNNKFALLACILRLSRWGEHESHLVSRAAAGSRVYCGTAAQPRNTDLASTTA